LDCKIDKFLFVEVKNNPDKSGFVAVFAKQEQETGAVHESDSSNDQNSYPYVFIK